MASAAAMLSTLLFLLTACHSATSSTYYETPTLEALSGAVPSDAETGYLLPRIAAKLRPHGNNWETAPDPHFYLLTELDRDSQAARRVKRNGGGPSLSIVNPLDVLRQRLLLEIARRRMRQSEDQILANRELLKTIGKRDVSQSHRTFDVAEDETDDVDDEPSMMSTDNNRSPQSAEWQASHSRWNRQYSSQQQS